MDIKKIIKESLLNEIGEASTEPYLWKLEWESRSTNRDMVQYSFITVGGSNLKILVSFHLLHPQLMVQICDDDLMMDKEDVDFIISNPYYYWDTEFEVTEHDGEDLYGNSHITISGSEYKTEKVEVFRIMSTLSMIVKNMMSTNKVRGFAFKPASTSRGTIFNRFFKKQLPHSKIIGTDDEGFVVVVNDSITAPSEKYDELKRDWRRKFHQSKLRGSK